MKPNGTGTLHGAVALGQLTNHRRQNPLRESPMPGGELAAGAANMVSLRAAGCPRRELLRIWSSLISGPALRRLRVSLHRQPITGARPRSHPDWAHRARRARESTWGTLGNRHTIPMRSSGVMNAKA